MTTPYRPTVRPQSRPAARRLLRLSFDATAISFLVWVVLGAFGSHRAAAAAHLTFDVFLFAWIFAGLLDGADRPESVRRNRLNVTLAAACLLGYGWRMWDHRSSNYWWLAAATIAGLLVLMAILHRVVRVPVQPPGTIMVSRAGLDALILEHLATGADPQHVAGLISAQIHRERIRSQRR